MTTGFSLMQTFKFDEFFYISFLSSTFEAHQKEIPPFRKHYGGKNLAEGLLHFDKRILEQSSGPVNSVKF